MFRPKREDVLKVPRDQDGMPQEIGGFVIAHGTDLDNKVLGKEPTSRIHFVPSEKRDEFDVMSAQRGQDAALQKHGIRFTIPTDRTPDAWLTEVAERGGAPDVLRHHEVTIRPIGSIGIELALRPGTPLYATKQR